MKSNKEIMNKYYTPTIEEFHVGFEYEYLGKDGKWNDGNLDDKKIINKELDQFSDDLDKLAHAITRIKYLDKEDIESLGWTIEEEFSDGRIGASKTFFNERNQLTDKVNLLYAQNQKWCMIYIEQEDFEEQDITRFSGIIKNKSELKVLMKQLQII